MVIAVEPGVVTRPRSQPSESLAARSAVRVQGRWPAALHNPTARANIGRTLPPTIKGGGMPLRRSRRIDFADRRDIVPNGPGPRFPNGQKLRAIPRRVANRRVAQLHRDANSSLRIKLDALRLRIKQSAERPHVLLGGRSPRKTRGHSGKDFLRV